MRHSRTACLAVAMIAFLEAAVGAPARAADPFPVVEIRDAKRPSHRLAYASFAAGAVMIGTSLALGEQANRHYRDYQAATEPDAAVALWERTVHYDRLASGAMIAGQVLIVTGVWLRFLRDPADSRLSVRIEPASCALSLRF